MPITQFPDPEIHASPEGIVAFGGDLHPKTLEAAYKAGIFPWPIDEHLPLAWFSPPRRGVLIFKDLHLPRSLVRAQKQSRLHFTFDRAFKEVIHHCQEIRRGTGTWITEELKEAYIQFHLAGFAHSVEAWEGSTLVGGVYGVNVAGVFAGESMFYLRPNASKLALLHLIEHLQKQGASFMDIQMITPHMKALGAKNISRKKFLELLQKEQNRGLKLFR